MIAAVELLAQNNFGDTRTGSLAGPMGLFIVTSLAVVTVLLIRNMNSRLRRLPDRFPADGFTADGSPSDGAVASSEAAGSDATAGSDAKRKSE